MALTNAKKERIAQTVIKVLYSRFESFPNEDGTNRNAPFHEAFLQAFTNKLSGRVKNIPDMITLSSWMHGLNTTLGQSFFESVAHILSDGQKKDFRNERIYTNQLMAIADIIIDLKNGTQKPSMSREDAIIIDAANGEKQNASQFTADCYYETDTTVVAIELKSVRPNSGEMRGEKEKILKGRAVLREKFPHKNVQYIFGFPFDPTYSTNTGYDKQKFLKYLVEAEKFLALDDFLIADELWSFLASEQSGTMQEILEIINRIATPQFMDIFNELQDNNLNETRKRYLLENWYLFTEVEILNKVKQTSANCRLFNQSIFKSDGSYNINRENLLLNLSL